MSIETSHGKLLGSIETALSWVTKLFLGAGTLALLAMAAHVTLDVIARLSLNQPLYGTTEIVSFYYMVATVCLPLAWMELRDEHITVEVLYGPLPTSLRRIVFVFAALVTAAFFSVFAYQTWLDALDATASREVVMGHAFIEIWPSRYFLPLSFGLLVVATLLRAFKAVLTPDLAEPHLRPTAE